MFEGWRVVEVATHVFVPSATAVLSDFGAEVVKDRAPRHWATRTHCHGDARRRRRFFTVSSSTPIAGNAASPGYQASRPVGRLVALVGRAMCSSPILRPAPCGRPDPT